MKKNEMIVAGVATTSGAVYGGIVAGAVGGVGLAAGGTAISVGVGPFIIVGAVLGLASYGVYRLIQELK